MATIIRVAGKLTDRTLPILQLKKLLDTFSNLDRAYALRRVSGRYTGPVIGVRRASDSVLRDIGTTAAGDLDIAALETFAAGSAVTVHTLYDQSGNDKHLAQETAAAQPRICNAGKVITSAGRPALTFDGTDDHLWDAKPAMYAAGRASVATVLAGAAAPAAMRWFAESNAGQTGAQYAMLQPDGAQDNAASAAYPVLTGAFAWQNAPIGGALFDGRPHQASATDTGTAFSQWIDGAADLAAYAYTRPAGHTPPNRFALGGVLRAGSMAPLPMTFSEAAFFTTALSTTTRRALEADQREYYTL